MFNNMYNLKEAFYQSTTGIPVGTVFTNIRVTDRDGKSKAISFIVNNTGLTATNFVNVDWWVYNSNGINTYTIDLTYFPTIPIVYNGTTYNLPITRLGNGTINMFSSYTLTMLNFTLSNTITDINTRAFYQVSRFGLNITLSNSLITIGSNAFYNNSGFTSITIPSSVTYIGDSAFAGNIMSVIFNGSTLPNVGVNTFNSSIKGYFTAEACPGVTGSIWNGLIVNCDTSTQTTTTTTTTPTTTTTTTPTTTTTTPTTTTTTTPTTTTTTTPTTTTTTTPTTTTTTTPTTTTTTTPTTTTTTTPTTTTTTTPTTTTTTTPTTTTTTTPTTTTTTTPTTTTTTPTTTTTTPTTTTTTTPTTTTTTTPTTTTTTPTTTTTTTPTTTTTTTPTTTTTTPTTTTTTPTTTTTTPTTTTTTSTTTTPTTTTTTPTTTTTTTPTTTTTTPTTSTTTPTTNTIPLNISYVEGIVLTSEKEVTVDVKVLQTINTNIETAVKNIMIQLYPTYTYTYNQVGDKLYVDVDVENTKPSQETFISGVSEIIFRFTIKNDTAINSLLKIDMSIFKNITNKYYILNIILILITIILLIGSIIYKIHK